MEITSGHAPRGPDRGDGRRRHRRQARPEARRRDCAPSPSPATSRAKIFGIATFKVTNPGAAIVYFDTATAQRELARQAGRVHATSTSPPRTASATTQLKQNVATALDGAYKLQTAKETADANRKDVGDFLNVMKYAMLGFAGIAFLVGIFLIVNTFSMLVAQRTREIGLMRAIGSEPPAGQPVRARRGAAARRRRLDRWASPPASASPSA